jgi:hypothetical protein
MPKVEQANVFQKLVPFSLPPKFVDEFICKIYKRIHNIKYQILIWKKLLVKKKCVKLLFGFLWILSILINQQLERATLVVIMQTYHPLIPFSTSDLRLLWKSIMIKQEQ